MSDTQRKAKVLVVEDDPLVREIACAHLEDSEFRAVQAADAAEAIRLLEADGISLVFTDVQMPGTNGITLARLIRAMNPHMPIILASGVVNQRQVLDELGPGTMFVPKPYNLEEIVPAIRSLIA